MDAVLTSPGTLRAVLGVGDADAQRAGFEEITLRQPRIPALRLATTFRRGEWASLPQLQARRQRSIALFGEDALKPYDDLYTLRRTIIHAAQMLIETYQHEGGATPSERSEWEAIISQGKSSPDVIASALAGIVQAIEHICRPVIRKTVR
jgi:hypothetical protein